MLPIKPIVIAMLFMVSNLAQASTILDPTVTDAQPTSLSIITNNSLLRTHRVQGAFPYTIPDNDPNGINIPIDMTGVFNRDLTALKIAIDIDHTFVGDLSAKLVSPNGLAQLVLFSRVDASAELTGEYIFSDEASNDLWATAATTSPVPAGEYRTSTAGIYDDVAVSYLNGHGGCTTRMNGAFAGLTPEQSNGIWNLVIADNAAQDVGQVNDAYFIFSESTSEVIFNSGFERPFAPLQTSFASNTTGSCQKAQYDFSGTGFSDYVLTWQNNLSELSVQMVSNEGTPGPDTSFSTGLPFATTTVTSGGDFDGDGIKDHLFITPYNDELLLYLIRRSSRPADLPLGLRVVRPQVNLNYDLQIGDYDGDGLDDIGFFVSNDINASNSFLNILNSSQLTFRTINTDNGITSDFRLAGGFDHNGDRISDLAMYFNDGNGTQGYKVYNGIDGSTLFSMENATYSPSVRALPGTFLPNGLSGSSNLVIGSASITWAVDDDTQSNTNINPGPEVTFASNTDTPITGDYDGDGVDDFAVWRANTDGLGSRFIIRPSGSADPDNNLIEVIPGGATITDLPIANSRIR